MWCWRRTEKIKWSEKVTNEQVLERILRRKDNWIGQTLRINCPFHDANEGQMTEVKGIGKITQLLDVWRKRRYWELKEEPEDRSRWKLQFINQTQGRNTYCIFHKSMYLLISSIHNDNDNNNNNNNNNKFLVIWNTFFTMFSLKERLPDGSWSGYFNRI